MSSLTNTRAPDVQEILEDELSRLQRIAKWGFKLRVAWKPDRNTILSGEVTRNCIFIYESEVSSAIATLHHEFIDAIISEAIKPYQRITNHLIKMLNETAYQRKEEAVEALRRLSWS